MKKNLMISLLSAIFLVFLIPNVNAKKIINIEHLYQGQSAACESVSAVMVLNSLGYKIEYLDFVENHLIKQDWFYKNEEIDGEIVEIQCACNPYEDAFVGNPFILSGENCGYGCFSRVLQRSICTVINPQMHKTENPTGNDLDFLVENYINKNIPVIIWATMEMQESFEGDKWILPNGEEFIWKAREHCLVLVGYDDENYFFNDPRLCEDLGHGVGIVPYAKDLVNKRFDYMGKNCLAITNL